jgi:uncharacterized protein YndB with AHSA1/START domain
VDSASRTIAAPRTRVFAAIVDPKAVEQWLPPKGAHAKLECFEPRPGGAFVMTLVFPDDGTTKSKTTSNSDRVEGIFAEVMPPLRIRQQFTFVSDDPRFAGTMTMTWRLADVVGGTLMTMTATDVPPGITAEDHQGGMNSSLANLAAYLEASCASRPLQGATQRPAEHSRDEIAPESGQFQYMELGAPFRYTVTARVSSG